MFSSLGFWEWAMLALTFLVACGASFIAGMILVVVYD